MDLGEESPEFFTLHTAANSPEAEKSASDSEGIAYNTIDFAIDDMYYHTPIADAALSVQSNVPSSSHAHTTPIPHTPTVQVAAPPFPLEKAAGIMTLWHSM